MEKPPKDNDSHIQEGMMEGLRVARTEGLNVGDLVYHPSDDCVYMLKSIDGNFATVSLPAGSVDNEFEITKKFLYEELINPKAAFHEAVDAKMRKTLAIKEDPNKIN